MNANDIAYKQERRALLCVGATGVVFTLLSLPFFGLFGAASVLAGAATGLLNLWVLGRTVRALLGGGSGGAWLVAAGMKLCVLLGALYLLFDARLIDGLALMVGLGALPIGIVLAQLAPPPSEDKESRSART